MTNQLIGNRKNIIIRLVDRSMRFNHRKIRGYENLNPVVLKPATVGHSKASINSFILIDKLYGHVTNNVRFL